MRAALRWLIGAVCALTFATGGGCDVASDSAMDASVEAAASAPSSGAAPTGAAPARSYRLGLTDFPYAASTDALTDVLGRMADDADLAVHHFDGGVPWPEALAGVPYPEGFASELRGKAAFTPDGLPEYVAITPLNGDRSGLAQQPSAPGQPSLSAPWDTIALDDPRVVEAYTSHAERVIEEFEPAVFAYAIEANMLAASRPDMWPAFVRLASQVNPALKAAHPDLPLLITLQADWFHDAPEAQAEAIRQILPYTDWIAVSTYPYARGRSLNDLGAGYLAALAALDGSKPFAVAEAGWPAEDIEIPGLVSIPSNPEAQRAFLEWLLSSADSLDARMVVWFLQQDIDALLATLPPSPAATTARLFRDIGLYDEASRPRPGLEAWRQAFARPLESGR